MSSNTFYGSSTQYTLTISHRSEYRIGLADFLGVGKFSPLLPTRNAVVLFLNSEETQAEELLSNANILALTLNCIETIRQIIQRFDRSLLSLHNEH